MELHEKAARIQPVQLDRPVSPSDAAVVIDAPGGVARSCVNDPRSALENLTALSTRKLRVLCNQTYKAMDTAQSSLDAAYLYQALCDELDARAATVEQESQEPPEAELREHFRDNRWSSAFELIRNGVVAGYVKYRFRGDDVALLRMVLDPRFDNLGVETALVRHVLLELCHRRLAATSFCPEFSAFVVDHPGFETLVPLRRGYDNGPHSPGAQEGTTPGLLHA